MLRHRQFSSIGSDSLLNGYSNSIVHALKRRSGNAPFFKDGDPPPPVDPPPPALEAIFKDPAFGNALNAAIKDHLGRALPKALEGAMGSVTESVTKLLDEKLKAAPPPPADPAKPDPNKPSPELLALQNTVRELTEKARLSDENAARLAKEAKDATTFTTLKTALTAAGFRPEGIDMLAGNLLHLEKKITVDENGNVLFKTRGVPYAGAAEQDLELPLENGLKEYAKTKAAQIFLAAPTPQPPPRGAPRIPGSPGGAPPPAGGSKVPSAVDDPGWHARVAADLAVLDPSLLNT